MFGLARSKPSGRGRLILISTLILKYCLSTNSKIEALSTAMTLHSMLLILSAFWFDSISSGRLWTCTQNTKWLTATSWILSPIGHCLNTIWKPLKFHGLLSIILSLSCCVGNMKRKVLTSMSSMINLNTKPQMAFMVEWKVCLSGGFKEMSFPIRVRFEKCIIALASGSKLRSLHERALAWMNLSILVGMEDMVNESGEGVRGEGF